MGAIHEKSPVLLLVAAFAAEESTLQWGKEKLIDRFGDLFEESEPFSVDQYTTYYTPTMGKNLQKKLWTFREPVNPELLAEIKIATNELEKEFIREIFSSGKSTVQRPLNLDPGYIDLGKLVLASTKDHSHRIYLQRGVFAELTLIYTRKTWTDLPWTYPDYKSEEYHRFFDRSREYLHETIRELEKKQGGAGSEESGNRFS